MSKQVIGNYETGLLVRTKINENFTEVYTGAEVVAATAKTTPVDADVLPIQDSAASNVKKKITWVNIKATLKTYFDTLYAPLSLPTYADNAAALTGGLAVGAVYKTATGELRIVVEV